MNGKLFYFSLYDELGDELIRYQTDANQVLIDKLITMLEYPLKSMAQFKTELEMAVKVRRYYIEEYQEPIAVKYEIKLAGENE